MNRLSRQDHGGPPAGAAAGRALRGRRRLPLPGRHHQDAVRHAARRHRPSALAGVRPPLAAPAGCGGHRCGGRLLRIQAALPRRPVSGLPGRHLPAPDRQPRSAGGPARRTHRPLHAELAPRLATCHARTPRTGGAGSRTRRDAGTRHPRRPGRRPAGETASLTTAPPRTRTWDRIGRTPVGRLRKRARGGCRWQAWPATSRAGAPGPSDSGGPGYVNRRRPGVAATGCALRGPASVPGWPTRWPLRRYGWPSTSSPARASTPPPVSPPGAR